MRTFFCGARERSAALLNPRLRPPNGGAKPFFTLYYCALWKTYLVEFFNSKYTKSYEQKNYWGYYHYFRSCYGRRKHGIGRAIRRCRSNLDVFDCYFWIGVN